MVNVYRSEVWYVDFNPPGKGKEIYKKRPALIVSDDIHNNSPADLVTVLPITSTQSKIPSHVKINPPEGGLKKPSVIKCDQIRTVSKTRFQNKLGKITNNTMSKIEDVLKMILSL